MNETRGLLLLPVVTLGVLAFAFGTAYLLRAGPFGWVLLPVAIGLPVACLYLVAERRRRRQPPSEPPPTPSSRAPSEPPSEPRA